jgi:hypothetical protein
LLGFSFKFTCYFTLFAAVLAETGGFRHLEKLTV